jgi:hypothetical protein
MPVVAPVHPTGVAMTALAGLTPMAAALASGALLAKLGGTPAAPTPRT